MIFFAKSLSTLLENVKNRWRNCWLIYRFKYLVSSVRLRLIGQWIMRNASIKIESEIKTTASAKIYLMQQRLFFRRRIYFVLQGDNKSNLKELEYKDFVVCSFGCSLMPKIGQICLKRQLGVFLRKIHSNFPQVSLLPFQHNNSLAPNHNGQTHRSIGTPTATTMISMGRPSRQ